MMRRFPATIVLLLLLAAAASAAPLVRELPLNVKVKGSVEIDGGVDTYVFDAIAGLELTIRLKGRSSDVLPVLDVIDPLGNAISIPPPKSSGKIKLKNHLVTTAGRHYLRVAVTQAGRYELRLEADSVKLDEDVSIPADGTGQMVFECLEGMKVKVEVKAGEKKGPAPVFVGWSDPDDDPVTTSYVKDRSSGIKAKASSVPKEGGYRIEVSLEDGLAGTARFKVKRSDPPKAGTIHEEDLLAGKLEKLRRRGPGAADENYGFTATLLDTGSIEAVTLEIPDRDDRELARDLSTGQWSFNEFYVDEASLDEDFPDGAYVLRIHREGETEDETLEFTIGGAFTDDAFATSPTDGFVGASLAPTVTWSAVAGAAGYDVGIRREGLASGLFEFTTNDPAETSSDVTPGLLADGPVYLLALAVRTDGLKTSQRTTRFSTSSTGLGYADPWIEKRLVRRPGVSAQNGEDDYHFEFFASFTGMAVRSATLEWLTPTPFPIASFTPVPGSDGYEVKLRWGIPRGVSWSNAVSSANALMPDGDYRVRVTYIDGTAETSDPITVGGRVHEFGSLVGPPDGRPVNVLTPSWVYSQDEDSPETTERTYVVVIDEPATGETIYEEEISVTRTNLAKGYRVDQFTVPPDVLEKKREYRLTWKSDNGEGWSTRIWTTFTTGSDLNTPSYTSVGKDHRRDGDGEEGYVFLVEVAGVTIKRARIRDPQGNLLAISRRSSGFFRLKVSFDTEEDLDQALPDGLYEFDLEYDDGTLDQFRRFVVGGSYPAFPEITTPTHGEKRVDKDPGIAWTYSAEDAATIVGFFVRITDINKDLLVFSRSVASTVRDTKVPSTLKLRSERKHELELYALGPFRKNARVTLEFKTK